MEKLKPYLLCLLLAFFLAGCSDRVTPPRDYLSSPFSAELRWSEEDLTISAELTAAPAVRQGAPWDLCLRFTAPDSFAGICVTRKDGALTLTYEGLTLTGEPYAGLCRGADLLLSGDTLRGLCREELWGLPVLYGRRGAPDTGEFTEVWLDPQTGYPKQLRRGQTTLQILSFQPSDT